MHQTGTNEVDTRSHCWTSGRLLQARAKTPSSDQHGNFVFGERFQPGLDVQGRPHSSTRPVGPGLCGDSVMHLHGQASRWDNADPLVASDHATVEAVAP
ncbi:Hypothetical protein MSYG_2414 [Malassezia sympodialis ATCC 42132]|uniref:Uncharacterized protein n=1 Tax=Malassezia sympodialis (strain ATCC 42132) TaxID=1230383 RepID=A0A1M8A6H4_MALS4|nr:Hypothetical protein MSYG_2414 [Malassezia sympodialis ATCC 42132]